MCKIFFTILCTVITSFILLYATANAALVELRFEGTINNTDFGGDIQVGDNFVMTIAFDDTQTPIGNNSSSSRYVLTALIEISSLSVPVSYDTTLEINSTANAIDLFTGTRNRIFSGHSSFSFSTTSLSQITALISAGESFQSSHLLFHHSGPQTPFGPCNNRVCSFNVDIDTVTANVSEVPLPAAAWFMGAGLAAFGAQRRKAGTAQARNIKAAS